MTETLELAAAGRLGLALGGGLGLVVVLERNHLRELRRREIFKRWRTWAVAGPLFALAALGPEWLAVAFVAALSFQALREFAAMTELSQPYRGCLYAAGIASAPIAATSLTLWRAMPPVLLVLATLPPLVRQDVRDGVRNLAYAGLGFAYVPWLLGYFLLLREHVDGGRGLLLALGSAIAMSDVGAYVVGSKLGRHKLAPALSPGKTWEGVAGNVAGAYLGFATMAFALPQSMPGALRWSLPLVVAAGAMWGDLVESLLKRQFGVKDAGAWLPGFGGLLDRIDSLLVVLPLVYTVVVLL